MADWAVTGIGVGVAVLLAWRAFQNPIGAAVARLAGATAELAGSTHDLSERS